MSYIHIKSSPLNHEQLADYHQGNSFYICNETLPKIKQSLNGKLEDLLQDLDNRLMEAGLMSDDDEAVDAYNELKSEYDDAFYLLNDNLTQGWHLLEDVNNFLNK